MQLLSKPFYIMSFFDPYHVSTRSNDISYKGQVIRQRPVESKSHTISASDINNFIKFLEQSGYRIYKPGIPSYDFTDYYASGIRFIQRNNINIQYQSAPLGVISVFMISLYDILSVMPQDEVYNIFNLPRPPQEFVFGVFISNFWANNCGFQSSVTSSTARYTISSLKYQFPYRDVPGDDNFYIFDNIFILENKESLACEVATASGSGYNIRVQSPQEHHYEPGIGGVVSDYYPVSQEVLYEGIKNREPEYNIPLLSFNIGATDNGTVRVNQLAVAYTYSFYVKY